MVHSLANLTGRRNVVPWILNSAGRLRPSINHNPEKIRLVTIILYVIISLAPFYCSYALQSQTIHFVSGTRNKPKSNFLWNQQHCYLCLIFFAVLDSTNRYLKHCTAQNPYLLNPEQFFESTNKK